MIIGVFDSGVGGQSVAQAIHKALPDHNVIYRHDEEHVPYGTRDPEEVLGFMTPIIQEMVTDGCQVIVIACNTISTTLMPELRKRFDVEFIPVEPLVELAVATTKTGTIAVCATPTTLASERYQWLKQEFAPNNNVLEPDCSDWAYMIENREIDQQKIAKRINEVLAQQADVVVLGCTHYHWIEQEIIDLTRGKATVIQPEPQIIEKLRQVIARF